MIAIDLDSKYCHGCEQDRSLTEWHKSKDRKDGLATQCKHCVKKRTNQWYLDNKEVHDARNRRYYRNNERQFRENAYRSKYGIGVDDYDRLFESQNGVCALCNKPESARDKWTGKVRRLAIDHCHETGQVRGLLCYRCNHITGCLGDNLEAALKLVRYMEGGGAREYSRN
jgi:hypothetical protein